MLKLINAFVDICLFRIGPQDLPCSVPLLGIVVLADSVIGMVLMSIDRSINEAVPIVIISLGLIVFTLKFLLAVTNHPERFVQALTAVIGSGFLFSLVVWPVLMWAYHLRDIDVNNSVPVLLYYIIAFWNIAVLAHIFRHALSKTLAVGAGIAILYVIINEVVISGLFPMAA